MTNAVATSTSPKQTVPQSVPVVILGTDAILAALPATAVQLAHACIEAGFVNVIPASWGDELIATATLRRLPEFGDGPVIHCSCPIVAHRLLSVSSDLRPVLLPLVPPPVALARYVRALSHPNRARVTYVGACPGAIDESIDIRMTPDALLSMLAERDINLEEQPRVFESFVPADRRRFRSQPGGLPTADALWSDHGSRALVEIAGEDIAAEVAQHILGGRNVLVDAAVRLGCACSGATAGQPSKEARAFFASLEPPRAAAPVVDEQAPIELDLQVPAAPRTPVDVMAVSSTPATNYFTPTRSIDLSFGFFGSPPRGVPAVPEPRQQRSASTPAPRAVGGSSPVVRPADSKEGKTLPRAYVARRRLSPRSTPVVPPEPMSDDEFDSRDLEQGEPIQRVYAVEMIEHEVPLAAHAEPVSPSAGRSVESDAIAGRDADEEATVKTDVVIGAAPAEPTELFATVPLEFDERLTSDTVAPPGPGGHDDSAHTDDPPVAEPVVVLMAPDAPPALVAIPLSDWTGPSSKSLQNSEAAAVAPVHWASGNGNDTAANTHSTPAARPRTPLSIVETIVPAEPRAPYTYASSPPAGFNARQVVLILLAVVVVAVVASATVALLLERRLAPRPTASAAVDR